MTETTYPEVPVLVVGGGSVGLLTAALLAHHGVHAVLVERRAGPSIHPRATGIAARSVEVLRELGLQAQVDAVAVDRGPAGKAVARTLAELQPVDFVSVPAPPPEAELAAVPFRLRGTCAQNRLDAVVADDLQRRGVDLRWSTTLVSLTQHPDGVDVELDGPGGRYPLRCAYVVGADGGRSTVRDLLGIGTSGPGVLGPGMINTLFRADLRPYLPASPFATCTITTPDAPGLLVTVDDERDWVFHTRCEDGETVADYPSERCAALVRAAIGVPALDVEVRSVLMWRPNATLADRFAVGRAFLVGDAAHTIAPLGAFGLNTGIGDAHNLAWKLAAVLRGEAGPGLLDTYAVEREPVGAATLDQALRRMPDPLLHWGTGPDADAARLAAGIWAPQVVLFGQRYTSTAVVDARPDKPSTLDVAAVLDGAPGSRVPHAWVEPGVSTLDLVASRWTLLAGPAGDDWLAAAQEAEVAAHRVEVPLPGLTAEGALLVRPDAIVAFRTTTAPTRPLMTLLDRLLARRTRHDHFADRVYSSQEP